MSGLFNSDGVWVSRRSLAAPGPGLILDRDGVLVVEVDYLRRPEDVRLEAGAVDLLRWARHEGIAIAVATNQSGIARGMFGWEDYFAVESEIDRQLAAHGLVLDMVVACPFHDGFTEGFGPTHAAWRKPGPAMVRLIADELKLVSAKTWMIGDKDSDAAAAKAANLAGAIHVLSGHGVRLREASLGVGTDGFDVLVARDLSEVPAILTRRMSAA
ncbi:MAG: HAD-IIIA family hydrolase [Rhizomicrobium sp.]